jgi:ferritin-like metal-binding protein YciE
VFLSFEDRAVDWYPSVPAHKRRQDVAGLCGGPGFARRRVGYRESFPDETKETCMSMTDPRELFLHELKDVYFAENAIVKALPEMISEASDKELARGLDNHLKETRQQVKNLEKVFSSLGRRAEGERCPGIEGIKAEHDEFMQKEQPSAEICDMFLTGAAARTEHYEIAAYTGLIAMARGLGERECVPLLDENLKQEKEALKLVESIGKRMAKDAREMATA